MGAEEQMTMDLNKGVQNVLKQYGRHLLGLFVLVLLIHNIFGAHGFVAMHRTRIEMDKVKAGLDQLNRENVQLEQEVKDLKSDPRLIEKIAREEGMLARPGEVIIRIPASQQPEQGPTVKP